MPIRPRLAWLPALLLLGACDRSYPLGTAVDAGAPPSSSTGGAAGGSDPGGLVTGGAGGKGGESGGKGGEPGDPAGGSGGAPGPAACPGPGAPTPERPLAIPPELLARRLAAFIWGTTSAQDLVARAAGVKTNLEVKRLAQSMFADPRFVSGVTALGDSWLGLNAAADYPGVDDVQGQVDNSLRKSMVWESTTFLRELFTTGDGSLSTLLLAPYGFVDQGLAKIYGVTPPGPGFSRVELPKEQRAGILTQASFLFLKPRAAARGHWLVDKMLCSGVPTHPNDPVPVPTIKPNPGETARQVEEREAGSPVCAPCHQLIDPAGFAFEHYDGLGRWRELDAGKPVDASGFLADTHPAPLKFDGARQLGEQLLGTCEVQRCLARVFLEHALEGPAAFDEATLDEVTAAFVASGLNLRELFAVVAASRPFLAP